MQSKYLPIQLDGDSFSRPWILKNVIFCFIVKIIVLCVWNQVKETLFDDAASLREPETGYAQYSRMSYASHSSLVFQTFLYKNVLFQHNPPTMHEFNRCWHVLLKHCQKSLEPWKRKVTKDGVLNTFAKDSFTSIHTFFLPMLFSNVVQWMLYPWFNLFHLIQLFLSIFPTHFSFSQMASAEVLEFRNASIPLQIPRYTLPVKFSIPSLSEFQSNPISFLPQPIITDKPIFNVVGNQYILDDKVVYWMIDRVRKHEEILVGDQKSFFNIEKYYDLRSISFGNEKLYVTAERNPVSGQTGAGVVYDGIGLSVNRSPLFKASQIDVFVNSLQTSTMTNITDRDYGQRVRFRDYEIAFAHDFDEFENPTYNPATLLTVIAKDTRVALETDVGQSEYAFDYGIRDARFFFSRNFENRTSDMTVNWGNGWQIASTLNFPDENSTGWLLDAGAGNFQRVYLASAIGVTQVGNAQGRMQVDTPDWGVASSTLQHQYDKTLQNFDVAIRVGSFTYLWQSTVDPDTILLPQWIQLRN